MKWILCFLTVFSSSLILGQNLSFVSYSKADSIHFNLVNHLHGPVNVEFTPGDYVESLNRIPENVVIGPLDTLLDVVAVSGSPNHNRDSLNWSDFFSVNVTLGDPNKSSHNDDILYALPYPQGKSYSIIQSWNGKFSHRSVESKYAIDFDMPVGDTICAARGGKVIFIVQNYSENGGRELRGKANKVVILHDDGTLGHYVHLQQNGALVNPGTEVKTGDPIALSGNTGFSTRPHLHFVVREADGISIPIFFDGQKRKKLRKGKRYLND